MHVDLGFGSGTLYGFLLVLARISGAFVFVPLPGISPGTEISRIVASLAITIALIPLWPTFDAFPTGMGTVVLAVLVELAFGMSLGLAVACFSEMLKMGAQIISTQAGFGYASTIDPNTSADSGLLVVAAEMMAGLLFFSLGLHREVIRIFAESLITRPPGLFHADPHLAEALWRFFSNIFSIGVRLALPSIALLGLADLSLGLLSRINSHLQLIHVSIPLKILAALALLAVLVGIYPQVISSEAFSMLQISRRAAGLGSNAR